MSLQSLTPGVAKDLTDFLNEQLGDGKKWVVYEMDIPMKGAWNIKCFVSKMDALQYENENTVIWEMLNTVSISEFQFMLKEACRINESSLINEGIPPQKSDNMNLNNLENLKGELKELHFDKKLAEEMEKNMQKNLPEFKLQHQLPADKGQVDFTLHFKQSAQSEFYYFNKYDVAVNAKPLDEGHRYLVISEGEQGKPLFRKFNNPSEAITFFKEQKGNTELASGKDVAHKTTLATMQNDKVNYVAKDFQKTFYTPAVSQTMYVEKGQGFTAVQAANLIQGRSVYRDNLLNLAGQAYKAWIKLDFDNPKDRFGNFKTKQFHDPSYGFDLQKTLDKYNIKELEDPAKRQKLEESLKNGNRPLITTMKEGQVVKLHIEAVPRYSQVNMFAENGKPEKREQFLKEPKLEKSLVQTKSRSKDKELSESQGMSI
jgi:hypothetical protein